jgi:hypothetical protein
MISRDLKDQTFGTLTVLRRGPDSPGGKRRWFCRCTCRRKRLVHQGDLLNGHTASCARCNSARARNVDDLTGRIFGYLTVLRRGPNATNRKTRWHCRCVCGAKTFSHGDDLRSGHTVSCGTCSRLDDITGQSFGLLTVLKRGPDAPDGRIQWVCICRCGFQNALVRGDHLRSGNTQSCGCLQPEAVSKTNKKHGMWESREYQIWEAMKGRCQNPKNSGYRYYGARGIKVAPEFQSFEGFLAFMGACPPKHSIDRIDNNGDYAPGNVRWATQTTQMRNTRVSRHYELDGLSLTKGEWAARTGLSEGTITGRMRLGWSIRDVLTVPPRRSPCPK